MKVQQLARKRMRRREPYPDDIIEETLVRLPVKSLLRFKYISNKWFSVINNPRFSRANLNHPSHNNLSIIFGYQGFVAIADNNSLVEKITSMKYSFKNYPYEKYIDGPKLEVLPVRIHPGYSFRLKCCCDGMLLGLVGEGSNRAMTLWNPTINEYKTLPLPDPECDWDVAFGMDVAFGYDLSIDDYKFVSVSGGNIEKRPVRVLTLKSNSWRTITSGFDFYMIWEEQPLTIDGKIYWIMYAENPNYRELNIVEFDLAAEVFRQVPLPCACEKHHLNLSILDGYLALVIERRSELVFPCELWVMKKEETWVELHSFLEDGEWFHRFKPLYFTKEGELVVSPWCSRIRIYDRELKTYKELKVPKAMSSSKVAAYSASLVSPLSQ